MTDGAGPNSDTAGVAAATAGIAVLDRTIAEQRAEVARRSPAAHLVEQDRDQMRDADIATGGKAAA